APLPRPTLPPPGDTNDARAYYERAVPLIQAGFNLDTADMALYWAARLDPDWANPLYARAMVILRALRADLLFALFRYRSTLRLSLTPRQAQVVDSLVRLAWAHNPLLFTDVDLFVMPPSPPGARPDPGLEGWRAYKLGDFPRAESLLAVALRLHPDQVELRISRAQSLALLGRYDSAAAELGVARDTVRVRAVSHASPVLPSLEMFERSEEHTSELQSRRDLVCRLLLEKKKVLCGTVANVTKLVVAANKTLDKGYGKYLRTHVPPGRLVNGHLVRRSVMHTNGS